MNAEELAAHFGVSQKTAADKALQIRDILDIGQADPNWWRPSNLENHPFARYGMIDSLVVDARNLLQEIQEGLVRCEVIPFISSQERNLSYSSKMRMILRRARPT